MPVLAKRSEKARKNREESDVVVDNSGPVAVAVPPLQQERERIADRGLAHASFKVGVPVSEADVNGNTVIGTHPPERRASRSSSKPAAKSAAKPKATDKK